MRGLKKTVALLLTLILVFNLSLCPAVNAATSSSSEDDEVLKIVGIALLAGLVVGLFAILIESAGDAAAKKEAFEASVWPSPLSWKWYEPVKVKSTEEAIADIKNIQSRIQFDGMIPSELDADKYGMRAKLKWVKLETGEQYSETSGGFFLGWNYIPTYSSTSQPWERQTPMEKVVTVAFKELTSIMITGDNNVLLGTPYSSTYVSCKDEGAAKMLANAVYTLSLPLGNDLTPKYGFTFSNLSDEQKKRTGITEGVVVGNIASGSPADKSGLAIFDIVKDVGGFPVKDTDSMVANIKKSEGKKELVLRVITKDNALAKKYDAVKVVKIQQ